MLFVSIKLKVETDRICTLMKKEQRETSCHEALLLVKEEDFAVVSLVRGLKEKMYERERGSPAPPLMKDEDVEESPSVVPI